MAAGNFSNGGLDTFDERKRYIGVRLQQGVPLLDRDWNEMEDIRRWSERHLVEGFVGTGAADPGAFAVTAPETQVPNDVVIRAGHFSFRGYHVENDEDVLFSEQGDRVPLPTVAEGGSLRLYLEVRETRVDATMDPDLANTQDVNMETCVRDRLDWAVRAVAAGVGEPPDSCVLAEVTPEPGSSQVTAAMIQDLRPLALQLRRQADRLATVSERLDQLGPVVAALQADVESLKDDMGRLFWEVEITQTGASGPIPSSEQAGGAELSALALGPQMLGAKVPLSVRVVDRHGTPVPGARLTLSTDWGQISPAVATTGADGRASAVLYGFYAPVPISYGAADELAAVAQKVAAATLPDSQAVQYADLRFDPGELALVSRYAPSNHLVDLIADLPDQPIVAEPWWVVATVTVHATEQAGVRGTGVTQVVFGDWIRDWALTKLHEVVSAVQVGSRVGDAMRRGVSGEDFDHDEVAARLPVTLQAVHEQTQARIKQALFVDPELPDDEVRGSGLLGQVITQEATAAVGATTQRAVATQLDHLASEGITIDEQAGTRLDQTVAQVTAGQAQAAKQIYAVGKRIG